MQLFASVHLSICMYRVGAQNANLSSRGVKSKWKNLYIPWGTKFGLKLKSVYCDVSSINWY